MCIEANHYLSKDMDTANENRRSRTKITAWKTDIGTAAGKFKIAADDMIPICQDTGMAVIFLEMARVCIWRVAFWKRQSMKGSDRGTQKVFKKICGKRSINP